MEAGEDRSSAPEETAIPDATGPSGADAGSAVPAQTPQP